MRYAIGVEYLILAVLAGCAHRPAAAPAQTTPAPVAAAPQSVEPVIEQPPPVPPAAATASPPAAIPPAAPQAVPANAAPRAARSPDVARRAASKPVRPPPPQAPAVEAPAPPPVTAAPLPNVAAKPAALDLGALEQRLRNTSAIGVFTKLTLKNQVDDLLKSFRAYHGGQNKIPLTDLRGRYDGLLLKVITLLQDGDEPLASAITDSREAIWAKLADRDQFQQL